jgi:DNA-directed RNA polymerase specialized sigma24 family protein
VTTPTPLDRALARVQDGETRAFDEVFDALWPVLVRYAKARIGAGGEPEDVAQRTLVHLFENVGNYDRRRPALGWALGLAYWECRTENTRSRRHLARFISDEANERAGGPSPEDLADEKEHLGAFREAWGGLSPEERKIILGEREPNEDEIRDSAYRKRKQRLFERLKRTMQTILGKEEE